VSKLCAVVALGCLAALSGCATLKTYPGDRLDRSEVAVVKPGVESEVHVVIESINGRSLGPLRDRAEVLPGRHVVDVLVILQGRSRTITRPMRFTLKAEAGREYTLRGDWFMYGPRIKIRDSEGELVAEAVTPPRRLHPVGAEAPPR